MVTRCRANYQQKKWDDGALLLGVYSYQDWQNTPGSISELKAPIWKTSLQSIARSLNVMDTASWEHVTKRFTQISEHVSPQGGEVVQSEILDCLQSALRQQVGQLVCMQQYFWYSQQAKSLNIESINGYFVYEEVDSVVTFATTDSCEAFSGAMEEINAETDMAYPKIMWTGNSENKVPVAEYHFKTQSSSGRRYAEADNRLRELLREIETELAVLPPELSDKITTRSWSEEGDDIHQLVDCVVLGPYASADLQSTFEMADGRRLPVETYHRGDALSRAFFPEENKQTGWSEARREIIKSAQSFVEDIQKDGLQDTFSNTLHDIRYTYQNIDHLMCLCPGGVDALGVAKLSAISCCTATSVNDLNFVAKSKFSEIWDVKDQLHNFTITALSESNVLQEDIWTSNRFAYESTILLTEGEREELLEKYVFEDEYPIFEYSKNEIMTDFTQETLWNRLRVDADMTYDPTSNNSRFLHGMEEGIERILQRARESSPVYWTHIHRYMASDSVWCESLDSDPTVVPPVNQVGYNPNEHGEGRYQDPITQHTLNSTIFVSEIPQHCVCGWNNGVTCTVPQCWEVNVSVSLQAAWSDLCARGTYSSRQDLFTFLQVLHETTVYKPEWFDDCADLIPSTTWGLLDSQQHAAWFAATEQDYNISLQELGTYGPAGLRLGLLGREQDALLTWVKKHQLLKRHPEHSPVNFAKQHTIAQPYCKGKEGNLWREDLTAYFRDVFFPMAHTVHTSGVAAYCSTWAVEYAIDVALRHVYNDSDHEEVIAQNNRVAKWRARCDVQLQQIGICALRGVYDLEPEGRNQSTACPFDIAESPGCGKMYVTDNCLVMCDDEFYDPCACAETSSCTDQTFVKDQCQNAKLDFDPRDFATDEVKLYSMHWPQRILPEENAEQDTSELDGILADVRRRLAEYTFETKELYAKVKELLVTHDQGEVEQRAPVPEHRLPVMGLFRLCASRSFSLPTNVSLSLSPSGETTWQSARSTSLTASPLPPVPTLCVRGGSFALCAAGPQG